MCDFFSFLEDENSFYHFSYAQRLRGTKLTDGTIPVYDEYASIAEFYGINEGNCNKYEYDPFTDQLKLKQQNMEENKEEALAFVHSIHWQDFCGDLEGARKFFAALKDIPFLQNNLNFDLSDCKVFDTMKEAMVSASAAEKKDGFDAARATADKSTEEAAEKTARGAVMDVARCTAWDSAYNVVLNAKYDTILDIEEGFVVDIARIIVSNFAKDIALFAVFHYLCANLPIPQEHIDHINKRYAIWANGYGVACDIGGVLYVYRRPASFFPLNTTLKFKGA